MTQPNWTWHDHNNFGTEQMIWLDGLDAKLVQYLDANFHENWAEDGTQPVIGSSEDMQQRMTQSVRLRISRPLGGEFPITTNGPIRFVAGSRSGRRKCRSLRRVYPGIYRPTERWPHVRHHELLHPDAATGTTDQVSPTHEHDDLSCDGEGMVRIDKADAVEFAWGAKDTFIVPPWRWHQHCNTSKTERAILFSELDLPVFEALDLS